MSGEYRMMGYQQYRSVRVLNSGYLGKSGGWLGVQNSTRLRGLGFKGQALKPSTHKTPSIQIVPTLGSQVY